MSTAGLEDGLANNSSDVTIDPYGLLVSSSTTTDDNCAILDNTTIECPLTVAETATIVSAEVRVRIAHTFDSDLIISAVAPDGTAVLLSNGRGGGADDFGTGPDPCSSGATVPTTFSDGAATAIGSGVAPFAGTFRPEATLSALSGHSPTGVWKLRVRDRFPADQGTVLCWGVDLKTTIPPVAAGLLYTGATTVQHSDPVNVAAHFASSASSPVSNEAIALTFGTQSTSGTTNATGDATGSFVVTQTPGAATATATFAGNRATNLLPASDTKPVVIAKEDCMLSYTGNTLVNAATATTLSAQFGENDSTPGTWTDKPVVFTVTDAALVVQTFSALTNAAGVASLAAPLGSNVYGVSVSFAGDDFYNPCATDPAADTIVTVQAAEAKITGGGWTTTAAGRSSFGFNVISDVTGLRGQLQIRAANAKSKFHAPTALTLSSAKPNGTWTGTGRWNGETGYSFTATVFDGGANGKKTDTISIVVKRITDNLVVFTTGGATALKGGNIIVR